jgi:hypothetical protein
VLKTERQVTLRWTSIAVFRHKNKASNSFYLFPFIIFGLLENETKLGGEYPPSFVSSAFCCFTIAYH